MGDVREKEKGSCGWEERERERERGTQAETTVFYNVILEVTYHQPYSNGHTNQTLMQHERESYKGLKTRV